MSAVTVSAEAILTFLTGKGFTERDAMKVRGNEIVYERSHKVDSRYKVLVYTSVRRGSTVARGIGKDAIRVCAIFEQGSESRGICKLPRVHRTGTVEGVLTRVIERAREAYQRCCEARPKTPRPALPRTHDGRINNCALNNHALESECQMCRGNCPDAAYFDRVQQKHHPGSWPVGVPRGFLDGAYPDDVDEP